MVMAASRIYCVEQQETEGNVTNKFNYLLLAMMLNIPPVTAAPPSSSALVSATCNRIAAKLASVKLTECMARQLNASQGYSVNRTPILIKEYPPLAKRQPLGRVLLIGGIHGDEYSSVSVTFKWMQTLDQYHSGLFHWHVVPLLNPDGLLRENSQRMNQHGVDLNRNFPTPDWYKQSRYYWVNRTFRNPRRYPGPDPLSEPESRWLADEISTFRPNVIISVHAPHGILDFDGPRQAPKRLGNLHLNLLGTYPGSLGNYAGVGAGIPVITLELPSAGIMPPQQEIDRIWTDLVRWLRTHVPNKSMQAEKMAEDQTGPS